MSPALYKVASYVYVWILGMTISIVIGHFMTKCVLQRFKIKKSIVEKNKWNKKSELEKKGIMKIPILIPL